MGFKASSLFIYAEEPHFVLIDHSVANIKHFRLAVTINVFVSAEPVAC
jgi:hypothetical protein